MVISTQSIYITKRYKQMLQLYKRSLGACVHMHYEQWCKKMIQNARKILKQRKNLNYSKCIPELKGIHNSQLPPTNEWRVFLRGVWWVYLLADHRYQRVQGPLLPSHIGLSGSDSVYLCVWIWSGDMGSCLRLWHWCCHRTKALSQETLTQSLSRWEQQLAAATNSASMVERATPVCLREDQETIDEPRNWHVPEVDLRSNLQPA